MCRRAVNEALHSVSRELAEYTGDPWSFARVDIPTFLAQWQSQTGGVFRELGTSENTPDRGEGEEFPEDDLFLGLPLKGGARSQTSLEMVTTQEGRQPMPAGGANRKEYRYHYGPRKPFYVGNLGKMQYGHVYNQRCGVARENSNRGAEKLNLFIESDTNGNATKWTPPVNIFPIGVYVGARSVPPQGTQPRSSFPYDTSQAIDLIEGPLYLEFNRANASSKWTHNWKKGGWEGTSEIIYRDTVGAGLSQFSYVRYAVHTSSTVTLRLYGTAKTYQHYRVMLCRMPDASMWPHIGSFEYGTEDLLRFTMEYGKNEMRQQGFNNLLKTTDDTNAIETLWSQDFVINEVAANAEDEVGKRDVRLHVQQNRVKDYGNKPIFSSGSRSGTAVEFNPTKENNIVGVNDVTSNDDYDVDIGSVYSTPQEQLWVCVAAYNTTTDESTTNIGGRSGDIGEQAYDFTPSYDADIVDRHVVAHYPPQSQD